MLTKFVNAFRPETVDTDGTGTYADGVFAAALARQMKVEDATSLRSSYGRDYVMAKTLSEPPRAHS